LIAPLSTDVPYLTSAYPLKNNLDILINTTKNTRGKASLFTDI
jgi:hypothetical protein